MGDELVAHRAEGLATIDCLSDYVLELIFIYASPYADFDSVKLVSKRWGRLCVATAERMQKLFNKCSNFSWCARQTLLS